MPNIIEQQDLLKGLPDNRLALLLQKPDAAIPPFLVAAEAQRRQAIRQQFAGQGQNESVVDSLTKQMANVPQNVQAPMQAPPRMPAPMMPQAGIAALQPQQAPQQMAGGGQVQRYQAGGQIEPMWRVPSYSSAIPELGSWIGEKASGIYDWATKSYSDRGTADSPTVADLSSEFSLPDTPLPGRRPEFEITGQPSEYTDLTPKPKIPRNPTTGDTDTSSENKYKAEEAALRSRLEELYGTDEPSNWEEAQKWFAMSAQIMNPDANLLQGLVNAGAVYADAEGEQARQRREGDRALQEQLLKWDMNALEYEREREQAAIDEAKATKAATLKARTDVATGQLTDLYRQQRDVAERLRSIDASVLKGEMDPTAADAEKAMLRRDFNAIGSKISAYEGFIGEAYGFPTIPTVDLKSGTIR